MQCKFHPQGKVFLQPLSGTGRCGVCAALLKGARK